jgi:hypothetical protein
MMTGRKASSSRGRKRTAGLTGSLAAFVGVLLSASLAAAQQPGPPPADERRDCFTSDAVAGGVRNPPRPDVVEMREACLGQNSAGTGKSVDTSPTVGRELDKLYDSLTREADEGDAAGSAKH